MEYVIKFLFSYSAFFLSYRFFGMDVAFITLISCALSDFILFFFRLHRGWVELCSIALNLVIPMLSYWMNNPMVVQYKLSVAIWAVSLVFLPLFAGEKKIQNIYESVLKIDHYHINFIKLGWVWSGFFFVLGLFNFLIIPHITFDSWLYFKFFGMPGVCLLFFFFQLLCLYSFRKE